MNQGLRDMDRLRELVRLHRKNLPVRTIARLLEMSPNTERVYRQRLIAADLLYGKLDELPELEALKAVIQAPREPKQERSSAEPKAHVIKDAYAKGLGPTAIYDMLKQDEETLDISLSAVKRFCRRLSQAKGPRAEDIAIPVVTEAGDVAQVDFGYVGLLVDPLTGTPRKAWVFVMVLGHSRHMYAEVVFDQTVPTWLMVHVRAFAFFGGVVNTVVPDNLKSAVIKSAFSSSEPTVLNRAYRALARHYNFVIDPAPPYAPEKKGKVERSVRYVKDRCFSHRTFKDLDHANVELEKWVLETAGLRVHGTTRLRPLEVFESVEKDVLKALPLHRFELLDWKWATIGRNVHVSFDHRYWSVPWKHVGKKALVRATASRVELFVDDVLVASHPREPVQLWNTTEAHLPEGRRDQRHRSRSYWEARADVVGEGAGAFIREVFEDSGVRSPLRQVASMMRTLESVSPERANAACARAAFFGNYGVPELKRILKEGLDQEPIPGTWMQPTWAQTPAYARSAVSFVPVAEEVLHGHNG